MTPPPARDQPRPQPGTQPGTQPNRDATYFDQWYSDLTTSTVRDEIVARALGLPAELASTSLLSWTGIAEVTEHLRLPAGGLLLDLACGRGGYGIEIARRTEARLIGVDFSAVALAQARSSSSRLLAADQAEFRLGTLVATGLPEASADAVVCVDAIQFAEPPLAALTEFRRLLRPGGRLVLTTWEAADPGDERVPPRVRAVNLRRDLPRAGFVEVHVRDRPDWREQELTLWKEALAVPAESDPAMESLQAEGRRSLAAWDSLRRMTATATAPASGV
jgi:SAM-dependent methyltransferase